MYPGDNIGKGALIAILVAIVVVVAAAAVYVFVLNKEDTPAAPPAVENKAKRVMPDASSFGVGWSISDEGGAITATQHYYWTDYTKGTETVTVKAYAFGTATEADDHMIQFKADHTSWAVHPTLMFAIKANTTPQMYAFNYDIFFVWFEMPLVTTFTDDSIADAITNSYNKASTSTA